MEDSSKPERLSNSKLCFSLCVNYLSTYHPTPNSATSLCERKSKFLGKAHFSG
jgi:hypothetical protein